MFNGKLFVSFLYNFCFNKNRSSMILFVGNLQEIYINNGWNMEQIMEKDEKILQQLHKVTFLFFMCLKKIWVYIIKEV